MLYSSLKACASLFRLRVADSLQYRAAALASGSVSIFWAFIEITVYSVFYKYADTNYAATLTLTQMVTYIWLNQMFWGIIFPTGVDSEILNKINDGGVGIELCRPLDLYFHWFAKSSAGKLGGGSWRCIITLIAAISIPGMYGMSSPVSITGAVLFLVSLCTAFLLSSSFNMLVTSVRLGITWGDGPTNILYMVSLVFSGGYLPLQMWPDSMQKILYLQPFAGFIDLPARLYIGSTPPSGAVYSIVLQLGWATIFIFLGRLIIRRRMRGIIVQGG